MLDVLAALALAALIALTAWLIGSLALRILGVVLVLAGLVGAATTSAAALLVAALGALLWVAGHWLYAVRHHTFAALLAGAAVQANAAAPARPHSRVWPPYRAR